MRTGPHGADMGTGLVGGLAGALLAPGATPIERLVEGAKHMSLCLCEPFPLSLTLRKGLRREKSPSSGQSLKWQAVPWRPQHWPLSAGNTRASGDVLGTFLTLGPVQRLNVQMHYQQAFAH